MLDNYNKTVSVIIPSRNEEKYIAKCLESFMNQTYPKELYTVFIADGRSTDKTRDIIKEYSKKYNNIKLIDNIGLTAPKGMNLGINSSKSDIVILFGAHAHADKNFILENVKALDKNKDRGCVGGLIETINDTTKGEAIALAMSCPFGVGNALFRYAEKETYVDTVAFGGYNRSVLEKIGLLDEELVRNQDDELNFRVIKNGFKILLTPKIKCKYYGRGSYEKLWKQYLQYGYWKVRVIQKHKKPASIRHLIPMLFVLYLLLGAIISIFSMKVRVIFYAILGMYILLDLIFSLKIALKKNIKIFSLLTVTFPILHLSYGIGFLIGIVRFFIVKKGKANDKYTDMSR